MDVFFQMPSFVTILDIGGGTIRDVLLDVTPAWMTDPMYLICTAFAMFFVILFGKYVIRLNNTFFIFDTIGLAWSGLVYGCRIQ